MDCDQCCVWVWLWGSAQVLRPMQTFTVYVVSDNSYDVFCVGKGTVCRNRKKYLRKI